MLTRRSRAAGAAVVLALCAACAGAPAATPISPTAATTAATPPAATPAAPATVAAVWPLTGLPREDTSAHAVVAVKIDNAGVARPQTGLLAADVVVEELVEGGITRLIGLYHSTLPPRVGPVRSLRSTDFGIVSPLRAVLGFSGGNTDFVAQLHRTDAQDASFDRVPGAYVRDSARRAPHNLYLNPAKIAAAADAQHQSDPTGTLFTFSPDVPAGEPTSKATFTFPGGSTVTWTYDAGKRAWARAHGGRMHLDASGTAVRATNVVIENVRVVNTGGTDPAGNPIPETITAGTGTAWVLTADGTVVRGTWSRDEGRTTVLRTDSGGPLTLTPGVTWVELLPAKPTFTD